MYWFLGLSLTYYKKALVDVVLITSASMLDKIGSNILGFKSDLFLPYNNVLGFKSECTLACSGGHVFNAFEFHALHT